MIGDLHKNKEGTNVKRDAAPLVTSHVTNRVHFRLHDNQWER